MASLPYEVGAIRPPSEARSLLIRVTRNCPWNKCEFCPVYKQTRFEMRPVDDILNDIYKAADYHGNVFKTAFLQDANSLVLKTPDLVKVISAIRKKFPGLESVTSYARARTVARKTVNELEKLRRAGLTRLHIGLESGYDKLLEYMKKGVTSDLVVKAGKNVKEAGISLCFYVILGLGGRLKLENEETWRKHALETARVLNKVNPDYVRVRTLAVRAGTPLYEKMLNGEFERASEEDTVMEEKLLIENLEVTSYFASDHLTNVLMEVEGQLPEDKEHLLSIIQRYLDLSREEKLNFRVGTLFRFLGYYPHYRTVDDFFDDSKREQVTSIIKEMEREEIGSAKRLLEKLNSMLV